MINYPGRWGFFGMATRWSRLSRLWSVWLAFFLVFIGSVVQAETISRPVSVAIPTGMVGELSSHPVSVAIPTGMVGELGSRPVSVAIPSGFLGELLCRPLTVALQSAKAGDADLIGLWHVDGDWGDSSGNNLHGAPQNGVAFSNDKMVGIQSGNFDGVDDFTEVASSVLLRPTQLTLSAWVNPQVANISKAIVTTEPPVGNTQVGYGLRQRADNTFGFVLGREGDNPGLAISRTVLVPGNWYHLVGTYDGSQIKFYVNGALESSGNVTTTINSSFPLRIGRLNSNNDPFKGLIDEVVIYRRVLTAEEILGQYNRAVLEAQTPPKPGVTLPSGPINIFPYILAGTKVASTSIWINGIKKVDLDQQTTWTTTVNLNYGLNNLIIVARNENQIDSEPVFASIVYDNVAPQVTQVVPVNNSTTTNRSPSISFKLNDPYTALSLSATIANATMTSGGQAVAGNWSLSGSDTVVFTPAAPLADGSYTAIIQPTDTLGNADSYTLTFTVDVTSPPVPGIMAPDGPVGATLILDGTRSADAATIQVAASSGTVGTVSYPTATSWRVTLSNLPNGTVTLSATARDAAGNLSVPASATLTIDTVPPTAPTVDALASPVVATNVVLTGSKEAGAKLFINGQEYPTFTAADVFSVTLALTEGSNTFNTFLRDAAGNQSPATIVAVVRDTTAPTLATSSPVNNSIVGTVATIRVNLNDAVSGVNLAVSQVGATVGNSAGTVVAGSWAISEGALTFTPEAVLPEGAYTVTLPVADILGNSGTVTFGFSLDAAPPSVKMLTMSPESPHKAEAVTFTLTFSEAMTNQVAPTVTLVRQPPQAEVRLSLIGSWQNATIWRGSLTFSQMTGDGTYAVLVSGAKDQAGNPMGDQQAGSFVLDTSPPEAPTMAGIVSPTKVATQLLSGTKQADTALLVNGQQKLALNAETTWSISHVLNEGTNTLNLITCDAAGNDSIPTTATIILDSTPPLFTIDTYSPRAATATQTLSGRKEPGCTVLLDGVQIIGPADLAETWSREVTLAEGFSQHLVFTASDALGNTTVRTLDLLFDAASPPALVAGVLVADGNGTGDQVKLSWPAYVEPADLAYYRIYYRSSDFTTLTGLVAVGTTNRGTKTATVNGLVAGTTYYFAVEPVDTAGNSEIAVYTASAVPNDVAAPEDVTNLKATVAYAAATGNSVTLTWTASLNSRNDLAAQVLYVDAGQGYDAGTVLDKSAVTTTISGLLDATVYKFKIATRDAGNHESTGVTVQAVTRLANPTGLTATAGKNQVALSWTALNSPYLASYKLYRLASVDPQTTVAAMTPIKTLTGTSWTDTGLTNDSTYQYAVTAVNTSGTERPEAVSVAATPRQDAAGPVFGTITPAPGQVITAPFTITVNATDAESAVDRIELSIDGVLVKTEGGANLGYAWNVVNSTDGNHTLTVVAFDTVGNRTESSRTVVVSLAPPPAPSIAAHQIESTTPDYRAMVSGGAAPDTTVTLRTGSVTVGTAVTTAGSFSIAGVTLVEGENLLTARATHRGGDSPWSTVYRIVVDTGAPSAPLNFAAKALTGGTLQFTWLAGAGETPSGYNLYTAPVPFSARTEAGVTKVNSTPLTALFKELVPANDTLHHYAVSAVDAAGNESPLSSPVAIAADRSLPQAANVTFAVNGGAPQATVTTGPALLNLAFTVSEPLKELPFFSLEPQEGSPLVFTPVKVDDLHYTAIARLDANSPHGPTTWKFSGKDLTGNRGNSQGTGPILDMRGPVATITAPAALQQIAAGVGVSVVFDEDAVVTPQLEFKDVAGVVVPIAGLTQTTDARHWAGTVDLSGRAEGEGSFRLITATDRFGNVGTTVGGGKMLLLYRDAPPAPAVPQGLSAVARAGGRIDLLWKAVTGATGYRLYRRAVAETDFVLLTTQTATGYNDLPAVDGSYVYAVSSVGQLNSESALSVPITATSDRTAPEAPADLTLTLIGSGVRGSWTAPASGSAASYKFYRAATPITATTGLTAVASATVTTATDGGATASQRHYAVTALDALGNESAPSQSVSIDFPVAPVKNLVLTQLEGGKPVLTWEAPQSGLTGYVIYRNGQRVNAAPTPGTSFTDGYYAGGSISYGISAIDSNGNESPVRDVTLPVLAIGLPDGTTLRRGLLETIPVVLRAESVVNIKELRLKVGSAAESTLAGPFTLSAGVELSVPKVAATPPDVIDTVAVVGTAVIEPAPGTTLLLTRTSQAQVAPAGTALEIFHEPLIRGADTTIRLKVNNLGSTRLDFITSENGKPTAQVTVILKDQDGNILAQANLNQRTGSQVVDSGGYATARIEPGQNFLSEPIVFTVPASAPYAVVVEATIAETYYHYGWPDQVSAPGLMQVAAATIADVSYRAIAQAEKDVYKQGEPVVITGQALANIDGAPVPYVPVRLGLSVNGFDRFNTVSTDAAGNFRYVFQPAVNEAGNYNLWAAHPDLTGRTVQDSFEILAMSLLPTRFDLSLGKGASYDIPVTLRNYGGTPLTGVTFAATGSAGLTAQVVNGFDTLAGSQSRSAALRVQAAADAPANGFATLAVTTAQGLNAQLDVNVSVYGNIPRIATTPSYLDTGVVRDTQKVVELTVKNVGLATLDNARIDGPSTAWMSLTVDRNLGSLAPNQSTTIGVLLRPGTTVAPGVYDDRLIITADNHIPYTVNLQATVTSDAVGNVVFDVLNELMEDVVGATINLQHQTLPELYYTLKTGADGTVGKFDIPEGRYSFMVSAPTHKPYGGSFVVTPGLTLTVPVALEVTLVEVEWSVTPVPLEDRYEITISQTFETNVPTSVLVVTPPGVNLPTLAPGEVYNGEFSITNQGLIKADFKGLDYPRSFDEYEMEVQGNIPASLGAYEKVIVPYRVTRRAQP